MAGTVLIVALVAAVVIVLASPQSASAAGWVWPRAFAEAKLTAEYETVDPWGLRDAREQLAADLGAGWPESSSRIRHDREEIAVAKRAASPRWAHCRGMGRDDGEGFFSRFWCTVRLRSYLSGYAATKKVTVVVRGREAFRVLHGWH